MTKPVLALLLAALLGSSCVRHGEGLHVASSAPSVSIEYRALGRGPLLVLLPSAYRGAEDLLPLGRRLARAGFRVLLPEPRGIGGSRGPLEGISLHDFADDVASVITSEGGGPAIIAGHAYGNWVARMTASDHPALVDGVVLIAAGRSGQVQSDLVAAIAQAADDRQSRNIRIAALRIAFFAPGNDPSPFLTGWYPALRETQRKAAASVPQELFWNAGGKPILEIQAAQDPFLPPANWDDLGTELGSQVTTVSVVKASHAVVVERPCEVAQAVAAFGAQRGFRVRPIKSCR